MNQNTTHKLDEAFEKVTADEVSLASISDVQLPLGMYVPDSLQRRESIRDCEKKPVHNTKSRRKLVDGRLNNFIKLMGDTDFDANFLTNLEVLSRRILAQLWDRLGQHVQMDSVCTYFIQRVKTGILVLHTCRKACEILKQRAELLDPSSRLIEYIDGRVDIAEFADVDNYYLQLKGGDIHSLAQWMPRSISGLSSIGSIGSSSGCSSPTSSIGASSSGLGIALTPRVHSKNPLIKRLLPWSVIKGFAQSDVVANIFESFATTEESTPNGREMYIFADSTVIALARSLLNNHEFIAHACRPNSPTKRRRDDVSERVITETEPESEDYVQIRKSLVEYIRFVNDHANDIFPDDSVSIATLIERHLQQLLPCAQEYLRENEFVGF